MESVGQRMTRSKAKALGTPLELHPHKTPEPRTTGRRRKAVPHAQEEPNQQERKQLQFTDEVAASIPEEKPLGSALPKEDAADATAASAATEPTPQAPSSSHNEAQQETHDNPSVLMASPIFLVPKDQVAAAAVAAAPTVEPVPLNLDQAQVAEDPRSAPAVASSTMPETCPLFFVAPQSPMLTPSPLHAADTSPLPPLASPPGFDFLQAAPSPLNNAAPVAMDSMDASPLPLAVAPVAGSPLSLAGNPQLDAAAASATVGPHVAASPAPIAASPTSISPLPGGTATNHQEDKEPVAAPSPLLTAAIPAILEGSPLPANTPLSFTSDAPPRATASVDAAAAIDDAATPAPLAAEGSVPATPLSITSSLMVEAMEAAQFSPMPEDDQDADLGSSPISLSGAAALTPQATPLPVQQDAMMDDSDAAMADATPLGAAAPGHQQPQSQSQPVSAMGSPLTFVSDCRATPAAGPSPAAGLFPEAPDSVPHSAAAMAVTGTASMSKEPTVMASTFQGFIAVFPVPSDTERQPESPSLVPAASPALFTAGAHAISHTADIRHIGLPPQTPSEDIAAAGKPSDSQATGASTLASPLDVAAVPRAPAPTPEYGALPAWTLASTPLVTAIAASATAAAAAATHSFEEACGSDEDGMDADMDAQCGDHGEEQEDQEHREVEYEEAGNEHDEFQPHGDGNDAAVLQESAGCGPQVDGCEEDGDTEPDHQADGEDAAAAMSAAAGVATPAAATAKTPLGLRAVPGRSPLPGSSLLSGATPGTAKLIAGRVTPAGARPSATTTPSTVKPNSSSYVFVESRYNKTPVTAGTLSRARVAGSGVAAAASSTPVAPTNAAAGAKSIKRVSIHTPEGPRSVVPQRHVVVPTPYRPKGTVAPMPAPEQSAQQHPPEQQPEGLLEDQQLETSVLFDERRAKAVERLKAIHASEQLQQHHSAPSVPGYLAPTQAFTVKAVKSKVDAGNYDPRSLRQLKREVKEAAARKEAKIALTEARDTKLTPKVAERPLPMPDDQEGSDDEAQYNEGQENDLVAAMSGLEVAPPKNGPQMPLRGLPAPQGKHIRFGDNGKATESPRRTVLRGLPVATGKYKRFD